MSHAVLVCNVVTMLAILWVILEQDTSSPGTLAGINYRVHIKTYFMSQHGHEGWITSLLKNETFFIQFFISKRPVL